MRGSKVKGETAALWITEWWDSRKASLALPSVKQAIARGRPLIAGLSDGMVT